MVRRIAAAGLIQSKPAAGPCPAARPGNNTFLADTPLSAVRAIAGASVERYLSPLSQYLRFLGIPPGSLLLFLQICFSGSDGAGIFLEILCTLRRFKVHIYLDMRSNSVYSVFMVDVKKKRAGGRRKFCYTMADVSRMSGRSIWTVRKDCRDGKLNMRNIVAVANYIQKHRKPPGPEAPASQ